VRLLSNVRETPTTRRIQIGLDGVTFQYRAGQAASLAAGSVALTPYSIASAPYETAHHGWLEFLIKVDGSSRFGAVVDSLNPGTAIRVEGPAGTFLFPNVDGDVPLLFVAGGTGIAPLRSMIRQALHAGHRGPMSLVYSARRPDEFAYIGELRQLSNEGRLALSLTLTGEADDWGYARGRTGAAHLEDFLEPRMTAFVCGPPSMTADVPAALRSLGLPPDRIRTEGW
jgi:ferredoxin-NADP reductase